MKTLFFQLSLLLLIAIQVRSEIVRRTGGPPAKGRGATTVPSNPDSTNGPNTNDDDNDDEGSKYYHEPCANNKDCYSRHRHSTVCKNGLCSCTDGFDTVDVFLGDAGSKKVCVPAPALYRPCESVCKEGPAVTCAPLDGHPTKICQCLAPNALDFGLCHRGCTDKEYYKPTFVKCLPKCTKTEILTESDKCKPLAELGASCEYDIQCFVPFSECKNKKCICAEGFQANNGSCDPQSFSCPVGEPLKANGAVKMAACPHDGYQDKPHLPSPTAKCPDTHTCQPINEEGNYAEILGICCPKSTCKSGASCPKPAAQCAAGKQHPNASCETFCPNDSHFCQEYIVGENNAQSSVCCKRRCHQMTVEVKGRCYRYIDFNQTCLYKEQCDGDGMDCIDGVCKCGKGYKEVGGRDECERQCGPTQIRLGKECFESAKIGSKCGAGPSPDTCSVERHALCDDNSGVCSCLNGTMKLSDYACGPMPVCDNPNKKQKHGVDWEHAIKLTEAERRAILKNVTFCKVGNQVHPPVDAFVQSTCPQGQYCAIYSDELPLGLCCQIPAQICRDGSKAVSSGCDPNNPVSCGPNNYCYQQFYLADRSINGAGTYCCKRKSVK